VVPPDSLQCQQEADIRDPTEVLLGPDPCIQVICHFVREMRFFNGSTSTQNGQAEDLGATQATYLGLPMPHRVPWLVQQFQPRAYRVAQRKDPLDGVADFLVLALNMVGVLVQDRSMDPHQVDQDLVHMAHNTVLDLVLTHGAVLKDQGQDHHTDQTKCEALLKGRWRPVGERSTTSL